MQFPRRILLGCFLILFGLVRPAPVFGQFQDFTRSDSFPNFVAPYMPRFVEMPRLSSSDRLHRMIQDGKLRLTVADAIALALENNLDIAVSRFELGFAETEILRTKSGGATRGISGSAALTGLFSGAIGSGVGGGGAGGGGGGGGFVGGGGASNIGGGGSFDPTVSFTWGWARRETPLSISFITGVPAAVTQNTSYQGSFSQRFLTGTRYVVALGGARQSTNSLTNIFNPEVNSSFFIGINQPLLKGFGYRANAPFIRVAKNNLRLADQQFRQQVMIAVARVLDLYWDLVFFQENVKVAHQSVGLAQRTLRDNKIQVEIGTLAPIEVVRAESEVAGRERDLITAQTSLRQQENLIKNQISRASDPDLDAARLEATDALPVPRTEDVPELADALQKAMESRAEITVNDVNLTNQRITVKSSRNALLPNFDLFGSYSGAGLSGNRIIRDSMGNIIATEPGGVGQSLTQAFHGNFPDYSFGVSLSFPIRNRQAQADYARTLLVERQMRVSAQRTRNLIGQEVRNALIAVTQARAEIQAAEKAVELARRTLDAEEKKYKLGESTVFFVIQAQRDFDQARLNQNQSRSNYAKAVTALNQSMGTTLEANNIQSSDARAGQVKSVPNIPGSRDGF